MKHLKQLTLLIALTLPFFTIAQSFNHAVDYLDFLGKEQEVVTKNMWKYTKALAHSKSDRSINAKRENLIKSVERTISKIEKADGFDGDDYKNQVLKHLRLNEKLLKHEYAEIVDMKAVAEQSYDMMEAYILAQRLADKKMAESQAEYETNLYAFAAKHNIEIQESESDLGKKMEISNQVFKHYNDMYLVFFKVFINEIYLWDAVENNDVNGIQQNANALASSAKEGLEILKTAEGYKNDKALILATKTTFNYLIDEAENQIPVIVDFLILEDNMNNIKETLEKTPERKRTKKQIDAYNDKVKEINKAAKEYNKVNASLNTERQNVLGKLDSAKEKFLERHIPKD